MQTSSDLGDLSGRTALVTGAGDVGATIARTLARHNAKAVAVVDIDAARARQVAAQVDAEGSHGVALTGDITDAASVTRLASEVASGEWPIDILVHNAGMPPGYFTSGRALRPFVETDPEDWAPLLKLNLDAVLLMTRAFVPPMLTRGWGRVVSIVSDAARTGDRNMAAYAAAKGGAAAFMRSLASEVGRSGVTVNCISLGTLWRSEEPPDEAALARAARHYPIPRYGTADDVAAMVTFLASDAASWVTGQVHGVNGGYTYGL